jgi:hypothetical protein
VETSLTAVLFKSINFGQLYETLTFLYKNVIRSWQEIFYVFLILSAFSVFRGIRNKHNLFILQVFIQLGVLVGGMYLFSLIYPEWMDIPDSATRMAMFFPPLFIYYVAIKT